MFKCQQKNSIDVVFDHNKYIPLVRVWQKEADYSQYILMYFTVLQLSVQKNKYSLLHSCSRQLGSSA